MTGGSDDVRPPEGAPGATDEDAPKAPPKEADGERSGARTPARPVSGPHSAVGIDRLAHPEEEMEQLMGSGGASPSIFTPPKTRTSKKAPTFAAPKVPRAKKAPAFSAPKVAGASERSGIAPPPSFGTMAKPDAPHAKTELGLPMVGKAETKPRPRTKSVEPKAKPETKTKSVEPKAQPETKTKSVETKAKPETKTKSVETKAQPAETETKTETKSEAQPKPAEPKPTETKPKPAEPKVQPKPSLRVVGDDEPEPTPAEPPARASRPAEPEPAPMAVGNERPSGGPPWALIGVGAVAVAVAGYFVLGGDEPKPDPAPIAKASVETPSPKPTPTPTPTPAVGVTPTPTPSDDGADAQAHDTTTSSEPTPGDSGEAQPALPVTRSGDPREPPAGTPDEVAAVFRRLPVSPSDGPPIGGIGANGIHIDELRMGADVNRDCTDSTTRFSVEGQDRAGVCVRVVHPREKDELQVLWEKHGGYTRRSNMVVLPKHAYRTRGYLKLRKEYIGDWTVRILSSDGVELAQHEFTIIP